MIRLFSGTSRNSRRRSKSVDRSDPKHQSRRKASDCNNIDPLESLRNEKEKVRHLKKIDRYIQLLLLKKLNFLIC